MVPVVTALSARYPACRVELTLGDETIDLTSGGMDVAQRRRCWRPSAPARRCCRAFWCGTSWPGDGSSRSCPSGSCPPAASTQSTRPRGLGRPR
ncbi:hypothetical protein MES5069_1340015 [Mesorhizobium escarrei]|uniref:LysR substrate-binding domain-containing protein n=1 Tax=Mesorhizobium escarrei TaxID=666018 RepID=A0ABN8JF64_9HYPH|nr:hypothetical protein MES5069_1340015 [Mesorhizobium escarrei]